MLKYFEWWHRSDVIHWSLIDILIMKLLLFFTWIRKITNWNSLCDILQLVCGWRSITITVLHLLHFTGKLWNSIWTFFCHSVFFSFLFPYSHKTRPFRIVCVREFLFSLQSLHNNTISLFAYENVRTHWFALKGSHKQNHRPDSKKKEYSIRLMFYKIVSLANSILGFGSADFFSLCSFFLASLC